MGIPKFYRWTSERYPCLSEIIKEYQIPEFDNLYLDMNGIIHNCSHPNDEDVHLRIPEENIFKDIFHYIEFLFKMIKPCKVFFMAIDGVAPRAKMNQQRGRRFRSARIAEEQEAEAVRKGEVLPSEERFDSNCITPGTEFMARLHEQLKYFVQVKVSTDPLWQHEGLKVYLSGHNVPGEGEHKIMDFIRHIRSDPEYDPSTRHCLYGLDADLVMLGLSTHELKFSLLREEVKFSRPKKPRKGQKKPPKQSNGNTPYDLSNVSVFRNENNPLNSVNSIMRPPMSTVPVTQVPSLTEGKSFADALGAKSEFVNVTLKLENASQQKTEDDNLVPPPPNEYRAKGVHKAPLPEKTTFLLLHLSLMRDYIDFEFQELKQRLENHPTIKYDLESVIDDWILMNVLVGNDFVPHLPQLHIVKGALPMLYSTYSDVLPTLDGYLNESGILHLGRFEVFIKKLSQLDVEMFRESYDDMKYMESKTGKNIVLGEKMFHGFEFDAEENFTEETLEPTNPELKALAQRTEEELFGQQVEGTGKLCIDVFRDYEDYFDSEDSEEFRLEFLQHKRNYYISKLEYEEISPEFLESFCKEYIRAIQWVLLYYYKGVSSWGWFYPFHYAPFSSDLRNFADFSIEFDKGHPFRPFEQLLAVLPSQSRKLLPQCYQWLMTDDKSPIVEFYPEKFEQDLNGKKQDWEAVVLIPFIDEMKLLEVMETEEIKLSQEESHRNSKGAMLCCTFTKDDMGAVKSPNDLFPELDSSHVITKLLYEVTYNSELLPKGIHPRAERNAIYQGFPTLKTKPVKCVVEKADIKVFDFVTREESMVLSLEDVSDNAENLETLSKKLIGRSVWVNWPHLTYAYVTAVLTSEGMFVEGPEGIVRDTKLIEGRAEKEFEVVSKGIVQRHLKFKGMKLGRINVIVYAKMMEGRKVRCDAKGHVGFETQWSKLEQPFALKTCMYEENITEIFYLDRNLAKSFVDLYAEGDQVFYLGDKLFGTLGTVTGHDQSKSSICVKFEIPSYGMNEFNMKVCLGHNMLKSHDYFNAYTAAGKCQISSYILARITGTILISVDKETKASKKMLAKKSASSKKAGHLPQCDSSSEEDFPALEMKKVNVGLDLKFNRRNLEVRGYTTRREGTWFYSSKAIQLVNDYVAQFYPFIDFLRRCEKGKDIFEASDIFPNDPLGKIQEMVDWLEDKGVRDLARIPANTNLLDDDDIDCIWQYTLKHKTTAAPTVKTWVVKPNLLFKPGLDRGCVPPIPTSKFEMLDRIICVDRGAPIPVGHRGTIVGIQTPQSSEPEQIEESFKSTGAATLMTLIVLSDPTPGIFDKQEELGATVNRVQKVEELTGALASLLGIESAPVVPDSMRKRVVDLKPRLIKLYTYQVINLSQGSSILRDGFKHTKQINPSSISSNGILSKQGPYTSRENNRVEHKILPKPRHAEPVKHQQPIRILPRPVAAATLEHSNQKKNPIIIYNSKNVQEAKAKATVNEHLQPKRVHQTHDNQMPTQSKQNQIQIPPKSSGTSGPKPGTLNWPPQPLMSTPIEQFFSAAALAQNKGQSTHLNGMLHKTGQNSSSHPIMSRERIETLGQGIQRVEIAQARSLNNTSNGIFSSATAFEPVKKQHTQNQRKGQDILQLLNNASEQYQQTQGNARTNRNKKLVRSEKRTETQHAPQTNRSPPRMPAPPLQWLPQQIYRHPATLLGPHQPLPQRHPSTLLGHQQPHPSTLLGQQHPHPSAILAQQQPHSSAMMGQQQHLSAMLGQHQPHLQRHPSAMLGPQQPIPQRHLGGYGSHPFPAAFVPLQVDRNRAFPFTPDTQIQQNRVESVNTHFAATTEVALPISGPRPVVVAHSMTSAFQPQVQDEVTQRTPERNETRKSRIAANFGNNLP